MQSFIVHYNPRMRMVFLILSFVTLIGFVSSCGYGFKKTSSALKKVYNIQRIYLAPIENTSYVPGLESILLHEALRILAADTRIQLVASVIKADAVLALKITGAFAESQASAPAYTLQGTQTNSDALKAKLVAARTNITTTYLANMSIVAALWGKKSLLTANPTTLPKPLQNTMTTSVTKSFDHPSDLFLPIWNLKKTRKGTFVSAVRLGSNGVATGLINDSEFLKTLKILSYAMVGDIADAMISMF